MLARFILIRRRVVSILRRQPEPCTPHLENLVVRVKMLRVITATVFAPNGTEEFWLKEPLEGWSPGLDEGVESKG